MLISSPKWLLKNVKNSKSKATVNLSRRLATTRADDTEKFRCSLREHCLDNGGLYGNVIRTGLTLNSTRDLKRNQRYEK